MILDLCADCAKYETMIPGITRAVEQVLAHRDCAPGKYPLDEGYFMIQRGTLVPEEGPFEIHRRYVDVQVILSGREKILWANRDALRLSTAYDSDIDMEFYSGQGVEIIAQEGMFYALGLHDAHRCCCELPGETEYHKAIIKIPVKENR